MFPQRREVSFLHHLAGEQGFRKWLACRSVAPIVRLPEEGLTRATERHVPHATLMCVFAPSFEHQRPIIATSGHYSARLRILDESGGDFCVHRFEITLPVR